MSRVTMLLPDCDRQLGAQRAAVSQMMNVSEAWDTQGALPEPFIRVTPNVKGHGEMYYHPEGLFVIRTEHRPILLTSEACGTCGLKHLDAARVYLFGSWTDFETRTYMRYVGTQIEAVGLTSPFGPT